VATRSHCANFRDSKRSPNQFFTSPRYYHPMLARRTFGKLGKRTAARLSTAIDGGVKTTGHTASCRVDNVSRDGCCLHLENPPAVNATVLVRVDRVETLANVVWAKDGQCGVTFAKALEPSQLNRLRWIAEHAEQHERNKVGSATAIWR